MLLETSRHDLTASLHQLGDAEICNVQTADVSRELATSEQLAFTSDEIHIGRNDATDESTVLDKPDQILCNIAIPDVVSQKGSLTSDLYDGDVTSSSDVFESDLGLSSSEVSNDRPAFSETSQDQASYDSIHAQEVNFPEKQYTHTDAVMLQLDAGEKSVTEEDVDQEDIDRSLIQTDLSETQSSCQGVVLKNDRNDLASEHSFNESEESVIGSHESVTDKDRWYVGESVGDSCHTDTYSSNSHASCSAETDKSASELPEVDTTAVAPNCETECVVRRVIKDPVFHYALSQLDFENRFAEIPADSSSVHEEQLLHDHVVLTPAAETNTSANELPEVDMWHTTAVAPSRETEHVDSHVNKDPEVSNTVSQLDCENFRFPDISVQDSISQQVHLISFDSTENLGKDSAVVEFRQKSDCLDTGIYTSPSRTELCDIMELIPVEDQTESSCDMNNYSKMKNLNNIKSLNIDSDSQTYGDKIEPLEFSQLTSEMYKSTSTSRSEEELEPVSRGNSSLEVIQISSKVTDNCEASDVDDNRGELAQPSAGDTRVLLTPDDASTSDQMLQCTNSVHKEQLQHDHVVLTPAAEVCDSSNGHSEPTDAVDEQDRTSSELVSASESIELVAELQNVDTVMSLKTTHIGSADTELINMMDLTMYDNVPEVHNDTKGLECAVNGESENTDTSYGSTVLNSHANCTDLTGAENSIAEQNPDFLLLKNEETSSTVCYANEDSQFSTYEQTGKQLKPFTVEDLSLQTQRLELEDVTLTITCFIPEENEEASMDDDLLEHVNENEQSESSVSADIVPDLVHHTDHNAVNADRILPYLMPIDETAEFMNDAAADGEDTFHDTSPSTQPADNLYGKKTEDSKKGEHNMACNVIASPSTEHAHCPYHELGEKVQLGDLSATSCVADIGITPVVDEDCQVNCADDKQIINDESQSCAVHSIERNTGNEYERHSPTPWFTTNQQDTVGKMVDVNKYPSEDFVDSVAYQTTTAERTDLAISAPMQPRTEDQATASDDVLTLSAADNTEHSSSDYSETVESNVSLLGHEYSTNINVLKQEVRDVTEHLDNRGKNAENNEKMGFDMETFADENSAVENSAITHNASLKHNSGPHKQNAETARQMHVFERPELQSSNIHAVLNAILQDTVHPSTTAKDTQSVSVQDHLSSVVATDDRDASHSFPSAVQNLSAVVVKAPVEMEEPAIYVLTDFESNLEQLHATE